REFDVAIAYLVRRLEEGASEENFMSAVFDLDRSDALFARERERFLTSLALVPAEPPPPHRVQDRTQAQPPGSRAAFVNTPDTDTSVAANRVWGDRIRERMESSTLGEQTAANGLLTSA